MCRLTTRCSGRVTIKCTRPTGVLALGSAAVRRRCGAPPLNGDVRRLVPVFDASDVVRVVGVLVVCGAIFLVVTKPSRGVSNSDDETLLHICLGDKKQMKRLISLEKQRTPGLSRRDAVARAIASLKRDGK